MSPLRKAPFVHFTQIFASDYQGIVKSKVVKNDFLEWTQVMLIPIT